MSEYWRLSERLREGIVRVLGWRDLRPVQDVAINAVFEGKNVIVLAPTAGGKTEAAVLPVVDRLATEEVRGIGALFMSPLRALLNNQEERLRQLTSLVGLRSFKWHGDVDAAHKKAFLADPAEVLMITPESLEVILATARYDKKAMFGSLRFVVVDEIHAFAGDDRGDHLIALLERVRAFSRFDVQRIGLSATVGNPEILVSWLTGSSERAGVVVQPPRSPSARVLEIHPVPDDEQAAVMAAKITRGKKSLFFADSRGKCERMRSALTDFGVAAHVHHSSVSRALREEAEAAFRADKPACIVCTSSMELGLDVGDLDLVMQLGAPSTVSSFLQRLGRTGRRADSKAHFAFLTDEEWELVQAVALVSLAMRGQVEPIVPSRRSAHVFVQQALARVLEASGLSRGRLVTGAGNAWCFSDLTVSDREALLEHLVKTDILTPVGGLLTFGQTGERTFGAANFRELYAVFDSPRQLTVRTTGNREIGTLDSWFAQGFRDQDFVFVLGGRAWQTVEWDWDKGVLVVKEAARGKVPSWSGTPRLLSRMIAEEMRRVLISEDVLPFLGGGAQALLDRQRAEWRPLLSPARFVIARHGDHVFLYTFAGGRINNVLGKVYELETGAACSIDNLRLRAQLPASGPFDGLFRMVLEKVAEEGYFTEERLARMVDGLSRGRLSKFQPYLPARFEQALLVERLLDVRGAAELCGDAVGVVAVLQ